MQCSHYDHGSNPNDWQEEKLLTDLQHRIYGSMATMLTIFVNLYNPETLFALGVAIPKEYGK